MEGSEWFGYPASAVIFLMLAQFLICALVCLFISQRGMDKYLANFESNHVIHDEARTSVIAMGVIAGLMSLPGIIMVLIFWHYMNKK